MEQGPAQIPPPGPPRPLPPVASIPARFPATQRPAALHICITAAHSAAAVERLLADLRAAVEEVGVT